MAPWTRRRFLASSAAAAFATGSVRSARGAASPEDRIRARPFPQGSVRLSPGPLLDAAEVNRRYLAGLDTDRLLHTFRLNAGLPTSATPLGGWEAPENELRGHFTGHYLTACALVSAGTGDAGADGERPANGRRARRLPGGSGQRVPLGLSRELLRPAPRGRAGLGALLHAPQDHGGIARPVHAVRQPPGARDGSRDGRLDLPLGLEARRRADGPGPRRRIRRHERFPLRARRRDRRAELSRARLAFRPRPDLRPAGRGSRRAARPPREHPDPEGHRRRAPVGDDRGSRERGPPRRTSGRRSSRNARTPPAGRATRKSGGPIRAGSPRSSASTRRSAAAPTTCSSSPGTSSAGRPIPRARTMRSAPSSTASSGRSIPSDGAKLYYVPLGSGWWKYFGTPLADFWCCTGTGAESFAKLGELALLPRRRRNLGQPVRRLAAHLAGAGSRPHPGHALSR